MKGRVAIPALATIILGALLGLPERGAGAVNLGPPNGTSTVSPSTPDAQPVPGDFDGAGSTSMLTITGYNANQHFDIVASHENFLESPSTEWSMTGGKTSHPVWDVRPRDGQSDVAYALQIGNPPLVRSGLVIGGGDFAYDLYGDYDFTCARTSLGVGGDGKLYLVVADGEGVLGGNGATGNQLAHFHRDVLGAVTAMAIDSGLSTEMFVRAATGLYQVNTVTGEDAGIQLDPYAQTFAQFVGGPGTVGYYLEVLPIDPLSVPAATAPLAFWCRLRSNLAHHEFDFDLVVPEAGPASLALYDVHGRLVAQPLRGGLDAGKHTIQWSGSDDRGAALAPSVYFWRATAGRNEATGSVVVLR